MTKGNYTGGHTIVGPADDPYRLQNTAPKVVERDPDRFSYTPEFRCDGTAEAWKKFGYDTCLLVLLSAQHAITHRNDWPVFFRETRNYSSIQKQNELLILANVLMFGRKFIRKNGRISFEKKGKLHWNWQALAALVTAVHETASDAYEEPPEIDDELISRLKLEGFWPD